MQYTIHRLLIQNGTKRKVDVNHTTRNLKAYRDAAQKKYNAEKIYLTYSCPDCFRVTGAKLKRFDGKTVNVWNVKLNTTTEDLEKYREHILRKHKATEIIELNYREL